MGEVLKIFISATSADLGTVRTAAKNALLTLGYLPIEQEHFGPAPETILQMLRRRIEESDAVLHIVGQCYGAEPPVDPALTRHSFTQWEYHYARELKKPLYVFVCGDAFPYTPHAEETPEARELQRAHRAAVLADSRKYEPINNLAALEQRIREVQLSTQRLGSELRRTRRRGLLIGGAIVAALVILSALGLWNDRRSAARQQRTDSAVQQVANAANETVLHGVSAAESFDPVRIKANLQKQIQARAAAEIAKLDPLQQWEKVAELEKGRDQQLIDVDRAADQIGQIFEKKEASTNYAIATRLLAEKGVAETLRFLESKSGARDRRIAALKGGLELTDRERAAQEAELREALREKLLAAGLLEKELQFDQAEAAYREVNRDGGAWIEPRHKLANLLYNRGIVIEPAAGDAKLGEAVELCRATLAANPRTTDAKGWADTQNTLGIALRHQGTRAAGAESLRLLGEAVTAYRAALELRTRAQLPQDWAKTQNNLAIALAEQGKRAEGAESLRLLGEAVAACRAALEVSTRAGSPQSWAKTQNNLGNALWDQGTRAEGAESVRLLGEAVAAWRAALEVYTRAQLPQDWAMTQNNLGAALWDQGRRAEGAESLRLLGEAVTAYRAALEVYTRAQLPQDWAMTQYNLSLALAAQGGRAEVSERQRLLGEAVTADRAALEVRTRAHLAQAWRSTMENLRLHLRTLAEHAPPEEAAKLRAEAEAIDKELAEP